MILTVTWWYHNSYKTIAINGCPGDYNMHFTCRGNDSTLTIKGDPYTKSFYFDEKDYKPIFDYFSNPIELPKETYELLKDILGFFPFMKYKGGWQYAKVDFKDTDELWSRKKLIEYGSLLEIPIPIAVLNKMLFLKKRKADICEFNGCHSASDTGEVELSEFPDHLQPYVLNALRKLSDFSPKEFKLEDLAVYDFLEFMRTFNRYRMIVGNKFTNRGVAAQAKHGLLWNSPIFCYDPIYIDDKFYPEYNTLLTDSLVQMYAIHMRPIQPGGISGTEITPLQARAMQVLLKINGYNITHL
jgi:hypothetical protein